MKLGNLIENHSNPRTLEDSLNQLAADLGGSPCNPGDSLDFFFAHLPNSPNSNDLNDETLARHLVGYEVIDSDGDISKIEEVVDDEDGMGVSLENGLICGFDSVKIPGNSTNTAPVKYQETRGKIDQQIKTIQGLLIKHNSGNIGHVSDQLSDIISFLEGS